MDHLFSDSSGIDFGMEQYIQSLRREFDGPGHSTSRWARLVNKYGLEVDQIRGKGPASIPEHGNLTLQRSSLEGPSSCLCCDPSW